MRSIHHLLKNQRLKINNEIWIVIDLILKHWCASEYRHLILHPCRLWKYERNRRFKIIVRVQLMRKRAMSGHWCSCAFLYLCLSHPVIMRSFSMRSNVRETDVYSRRRGEHQSAMRQCGRMKHRRIVILSGPGEDCEVEI